MPTSAIVESLYTFRGYQFCAAGNLLKHNSSLHGMKNAFCTRQGLHSYGEKQLMRKFLHLRLNGFIPLGLMAFAAAVLLAPAPANATPYVVKLMQQGNNVVANGNGAIDVTGLGPFGSGSSQSGIDASMPAISTGSSSGIDFYVGFATGPANFGSGSLVGSDGGSGDPTGFTDNIFLFGFYVAAVDVPAGYVSGTALSGSATWDGATFTSLGVTPGTYTWTWGAGAEQRFTLDIVAPTVAAPEPAAVGMFGFGVLLIGLFVGLRRRLV